MFNSFFDPIEKLLRYLIALGQPRKDAVVLLVDTSGSVATFTPLLNATVAMFHKTLPAWRRYLTFSGWYQGDDVVKDRTAEIGQPVSIVPNGGTDYDAGLRVALRHLNDPSADGHQKRIILLTDGFFDQGQPSVQIPSDVRIDIVLFDQNHEGTPDQMRAYAAKTGGDFFHLVPGALSSEQVVILARWAFTNFKPTTTIESIQRVAKGTPAAVSAFSHAMCPGRHVRF